MGLLAAAQGPPQSGSASARYRRGVQASRAHAPQPWPTVSRMTHGPHGPPRPTHVHDPRPGRKPTAHSPSPEPTAQAHSTSVMSPLALWSCPPSAARADERAGRRELDLSTARPRRSPKRATRHASPEKYCPEGAWAGSGRPCLSIGPRPPFKLEGRPHLSLRAPFNSSLTAGLPVPFTVRGDVEELLAVVAAAAAVPGKPGSWERSPKPQLPGATTGRSARKL